MMQSAVHGSSKRGLDQHPVSGAPSRGSVAVKRTHSEGGERVNSSINVMSLSLRPVMGLRLDKVVAPDTHFSGSSDEPSPFVNIEFHQTFVSHFQ
jgi:hypothetical protein